MASGPPRPASDPLRVVFMGTPALAAHILERIARAAGPDFELVGVVTRPDRPQGRGLKLAQSDVAAVASRHRIPTLKPEKVRTHEFLAELEAFAPDVLAVAAYGRILPSSVLRVPRLMPINVHASLLPRHRGASPIEAAILAGDQVSGVTIMRITEEMDAGSILTQATVPIAATETRATLESKLAQLGAEKLIEALGRLKAGELPETAQDASLATYTSLIKKEHARIDWSLDAVQIERATRAFDPWPVAFTMLVDEELRIYRASVEPTNSGAPPGTIVRIDPQPTVQCGVGCLRLLEVQAAGRRRMSASDFARGRRLTAGQRLK